LDPRGIRGVWSDAHGAPPRGFTALSFYSAVVN
jgi:hypothetical protein